MNYCACKGIRTCLICERRKNIGKELAEDVMSRDSYYCCMRCGKLVRSIDVSFTTEDNNTSVCDPPCNGESDTIVVEDQVISPDVKFGGIFLYKNFVSPEEEAGLVSDIDSAHWVDSQSGRRKQVPKSRDSSVSPPLSGFWSKSEFQKTKNTVGHVPRATRLHTTNYRQN